MNRCLRARSGTHSGFLSPPAPRGVNGSGQSLRRAFKSRVIFKPLSDFDPSMLKAGASPAFLFVRPMASATKASGHRCRRSWLFFS